MTTPLARDPNTVGWEQTIHAFLAEKERRSGSRRTVKSYPRMLYQFFGSLGKPPGQITAPEVFGYAHGVGLSGKKPSSVTIGARIACLSSSIGSSFAWTWSAATLVTSWSGPRLYWIRGVSLT